MNRVWRISADTGGTFTDCVGVAPDGSRHRAKVLSTGALRAGVIEAAPGRVRLDRNRTDGLLVGWTLRDLASDASATVIAHHGDTLELDADLPLAAGTRVELRTGEEAPVVGARLMTLTPLNEPLPPIEMRLATTRGTNALLERRGAPVCLFVTAGFADLLTIGDQTRPDLFALEVVKPEPLPRRVVEVPGRIAADGTELTPLDRAAIEAEARRRLSEGVGSAAVCLMHAWRNPDHERALAGFLRGLGFAHVSVSHELASAIGYLHRAETAAVDAYLAEVLETYLESVRAPMSGSLRVLTSAGGLADADEFRPKDGLLSGPAGGVVGARAAGAGLGPLLAFDMGGTSTDASRIAGSLDYAPAHTVGGVRIVAPALRIETVAAGGGSVCAIDRGEMRVGPESAGADPGPACYGAGGPLTVTDANLLLGRLDPDRFGIPVDVAAARARADEMLASAHAQIDAALTPEDLLEGFVTIADERMADAVRAISAREGFDPADHTLVAFGGAGPQHACGVAERLGVKRVLVPTDTGLLSAVGLAASPLERFARRQVLRPFDEIDDGLPVVVRALGDEARGALAGDAQTETTVALRFVGQDFTIDVPFVADVDTLHTHFLRRYRDLFEHDPPDRPIEVESVRARAWIGEDPPDAGCRGLSESPSEGHDRGERERTTRTFFDGAWRDVRVMARTVLTPGVSLAGPSLIHETHSSTVLRPGWTLACRADGSLLLTRESDAAHAVARDPAVRRELFINRLSAAAVEMGERLRRTALSVNVKERADFSCAILDAGGRLVVNAPHVPVHLGALGLCVRSVCAQMELAPGDAVITNHPAHGGSHLPDVTVIAPIHSAAGSLLGYAAARAHHAEIGGTQPGSMPAGVRTLSEEGVVIPPTRIARGGRIDRDALRAVFASGPCPSRRIDENLADAEAQLAACAHGARAVRTLFGQAGEGKAEAFIEDLLDRAERRAREGLARIGGLPRAAETTLDDGSRLSVRIGQGDDGRVVFDFAGTSGVHPSNLNATPAIVTSAVLYVLRLIAAEEMPLNEGLARAVKLRIPEGMLNPPFAGDPARCPAVAGGNVETSQRLVNLLLRALGLAAASQGTMNNVTFGNERCSCYETLAGGCGAGPGFAGASAVHSHMTNTRITDAEVMEHRLPVIVRRFAVRRGSGGAGAFRGGDGLVREIEFTEPVRINVLAEHRTSGPEGMNGGGNGAPGSQRLVRADGTGAADPMPWSAAPGDRLIVETPGGGGWG